ncbi:MAG: N-acetylneuraminate synthase [Candidatus Electrothrix scaldis]|nr:MAG: N-acetylneuraminate synthase [Candidatus Electrothrix sp. GW3-3]
MFDRKCPYIIAEAGVNHNGSPELALQLIDAALEAGADAVKFQTFKADNLVTALAEKAQYQKETTGKNESQLVMLRKLELSRETHFRLVERCREVGIDFMSTAFDFDSLDFLVQDIGLTVLKIPSGEITNAPFLLAHARTGRALILSTGMATLGEIEMALGVLAFGFIQENAHVTPSISAFQEAYYSREGQHILQKKVILLHCTTEYPAPPENINLKAMETMSRSFGLQVGYSDHSEGITVPIAATTLGACIIEKHFTLDKSLDGPDHKASLDPNELKTMVNALRSVEQIMGDGVKGPRPAEFGNRTVARKSIVATRNIRQGDIFTEENLTLKRPGTGLSPFRYWDVLGQKATRNYDKDEVVSM